MIKKCVVCGLEFEAKRDSAKYCCKKCRNHSKSCKTFEQIREDNKKITEYLIDLYNSGLNDREIAPVIKKSVSWVQKTRTDIGLPRQVRAKQPVAIQIRFKSCRKCNSIFIPKNKTQVYCSVICERRANHKVRDYDRKRLERKQRIDYIPLPAVYEKYNGICYLCGGLCDWNAKKIINGVGYALGDYPSRDHVIPLSKGGLHAWSNVRLAHVRCNSSKGAKL